MAGDLDFLPLINALIRSGILVQVFYDERSASADLFNAADRRQRIGIGDYLNFTPGNITRVLPSLIENDSVYPSAKAKTLKYGITNKNQSALLWHIGDKFYLTISPPGTQKSIRSWTHAEFHVLENLAREEGWEIKWKQP